MTSHQSNFSIFGPVSPEIMRCQARHFWGGHLIRVVFSILYQALHIFYWVFYHCWCFTCFNFFVTKNIYVIICIHPVEFLRSLILWCLRLMCCMVTHKYSLSMIHLPHLVWQEPPHIYIITKMDISLTNNRELASQVTDALNTELYERNIGGGYNTTRFMIFQVPHGRSF